MKSNHSTTFLYLFSSKTHSGNWTKCKIGITSNVTRRRKEIQSSSGHTLKVTHTIICESLNQAKDLERSIFNILDAVSARKLKGEWYWLCQSDISFIKSLKNYGDLNSSVFEMVVNAVNSYAIKLDQPISKSTQLYLFR